MQRNRHSAFSFIEVLFAVILLGIGFIMIAGIFPVAIQQTAVVSNETEGTLITRDAIRKIQAIADAPSNFPPPTAGTSNSLFQPTLRGTVPVVEAFSPNLMQALGSDSFFTADRRFSWIGFYRRDSASSPFAQVYVIALENPNFPNYITPYVPGSPETTVITGATVNQPMVPPWAAVPPPIPPNLYNQGPTTAFGVPPAPPAPGIPALATPTATLTYDVPTGSGNSTVSFSGAVSNAVTGAFLLVADDGSASAPTQLTGRIFRLGTETTTSASPGPSFILLPGSDILSDYLTSGSFRTVTFFLIGRAPTLGPAAKYSYDYTGPFTGPNQDIAATSAFIRVNTSNN